MTCNQKKTEGLSRQPPLPTQTLTPFFFQMAKSKRIPKVIVNDSSSGSEAEETEPVSEPVPSEQQRGKDLDGYHMWPHVTNNRDSKSEHYCISNTVSEERSTNLVVCTDTESMNLSSDEELRIPSDLRKYCTSNSNGFNPSCGQRFETLPMFTAHSENAHGVRSEEESKRTSQSNDLPAHDKANDKAITAGSANATTAGNDKSTEIATAHNKTNTATKENIPLSNIKEVQNYIKILANPATTSENELIASLINDLKNGARRQNEKQQQLSTFGMQNVPIPNIKEVGGVSQQSYLLQMLNQSIKNAHAINERQSTSNLKQTMNPSTQASTTNARQQPVQHTKNPSIQTSTTNVRQYPIQQLMRLQNVQASVPTNSRQLSMHHIIDQSTEKAFTQNTGQYKSNLQPVTIPNGLDTSTNARQYPVQHTIIPNKQPYYRTDEIQPTVQQVINPNQQAFAVNSRTYIPNAQYTMNQRQQTPPITERQYISSMKNTTNLNGQTLTNTERQYTPIRQHMMNPSQQTPSIQNMLKTSEQTNTSSERQPSTQNMINLSSHSYKRATNEQRSTRNTPKNQTIAPVGLLNARNMVYSKTLNRFCTPEEFKAFDVEPKILQNSKPKANTPPKSLQTANPSVSISRNITTPTPTKVQEKAVLPNIPEVTGTSRDKSKSPAVSTERTMPSEISEESAVSSYRSTPQDSSVSVAKSPSVVVYEPGTEAQSMLPAQPSDGVWPFQLGYAFYMKKRYHCNVNRTGGCKKSFLNRPVLIQHLNQVHELTKQNAIALRETVDGNVYYAYNKTFNTFGLNNFHFFISDTTLPDKVVDMLISTGLPSIVVENRMFHNMVTAMQGMLGHSLVVPSMEVTQDLIKKRYEKSQSRIKRILLDQEHIVYSVHVCNPLHDAKDNVIIVTAFYMDETWDVKDLVISMESFHIDYTSKFDKRVISFNSCKTKTTPRTRSRKEN